VIDLRKFARGQLCAIRLPGCSGGGEDTVLAHYRLAGLCGVGLKPPDMVGAHACHRCHDLVDGRTKTDMSRDFLLQAFAEGVMRTLYRLHEQGMKIKP
jgi:hypothetical protein